MIQEDDVARGMELSTELSLYMSGNNDHVVLVAAVHLLMRVIVTLGLDIDDVVKLLRLQHQIAVEAQIKGAH